MAPIRHGENNPTWELTFSVLPSLRSAADPRSDSGAGVKPGASITASLGRGRADGYSVASGLTEQRGNFGDRKKHALASAR